MEQQTKTTTDRLYLTHHLDGYYFTSEVITREINAWCVEYIEANHEAIIVQPSGWNAETIQLAREYDKNTLNYVCERLTTYVNIKFEPKIKITVIKGE